MTVPSNLDVNENDLNFMDDTDQIIRYFVALFDLSSVFSPSRKTNFLKELLAHGWSMENIVHFENSASLRTNYSKNSFVETQARVEGNGAFMNPTAVIL